MMLLAGMTAQGVGRDIFGSLEGQFETVSRWGVWQGPTTGPPFDFAQGGLFGDDNQNCNSKNNSRSSAIPHRRAKTARRGPRYGEDDGDNCSYAGDILVG
jgi:hypothetical protein